MQRLELRISEDLDEKLRKESKKLSLPVSEIVRRKIQYEDSRLNFLEDRFKDIEERFKNFELYNRFLSNEIGSKIHDMEVELRSRMKQLESIHELVKEISMHYQDLFMKMIVPLEAIAGKQNDLLDFVQDIQKAKIPNLHDDLIKLDDFCFIFLQKIVLNATYLVHMLGKKFPEAYNKPDSINYAQAQLEESLKDSKREFEP